MEDIILYLCIPPSTLSNSVSSFSISLSHLALVINFLKHSFSLNFQISLFSGSLKTREFQGSVSPCLFVITVCSGVFFVFFFGFFFVCLFFAVPQLIQWNRSLSCLKFREGNDTPLQYSCLENPMDGGAW